MASTRIYRNLAQNNGGKLTVSFWVKRAKLGATQEVVANWYSGSYNATIRFLSDDTLDFTDYRTAVIMKRATNRKFRDVNAWYHIVCNFDNTLGTPSQKVFVNGVEETSFASSTNYSQNGTTSWNTDYTHEIGATNSASYFDGSLADLYFIQGQQYDASTFGETDATTGEWKPKTDPTINYGATGNNSYNLKFENSANMDLDSGDNTVSFTTAGSLTQTEDCPANVFATFNPLHNTSATMSNGNTTAQSTNANYISGVSTLGTKTGKFYAEFKLIAEGASGESVIGVTALVRPTSAIIAQTGNFGIRNNNGLNYYTSGGTAFTATSQHNNFTVNDIIGVALDMDNGRVYFSKNGGWWNGASTWTGTSPSSYITLQTDIYDEFFFECGDAGASVNATWNANFGNGYFGTTAVSSAGTNASNNGIFEYDVPTGYTALSTQGLNK
jgi:hypothetical protein